jgi:DNA polymerase V
MTKQFSKACLPPPELFPLFLSSVEAGFPSPADDFIEMQLDLNRLVVKNAAATFFVKVAGDSMIDAGIRSGDLLVVDRSLAPASGKIVVAIIHGEFTVKRIKITKNKIFLVPENRSYPTLEMHPESDFQVWGVVTYVIHQAS